MARCHLPLLLLLFAWSHAEQAPRRRRSRGTHASVPDALTEHMQRLYLHYARPGHAAKDGNTVRSVKAHWGFLGSQRLQIFNLTSLRSSESVLSATLHFSPVELGAGSSQDLGQLRVWSYGSRSGRALGHVRFPLPHVRARGGAWQWRDVTRLVNAGCGEEPLIAVRAVSRGSPVELAHPPYLLLYANDSAISEPEGVASTLRRPHLSALETEPGGVASTLRRPHLSTLETEPGGVASTLRRPHLSALETEPGGVASTLRRPHLSTLETAAQSQPHNNSRTTAPPRHRRSVNLLSPLQNNELPEREYPQREYPQREYPGQQYPGQQYPGQQYPYEPGWDEASPYRRVDENAAESPKDPPNQRRAKKKSRKEGKQKVALLQFDERTMKKARRKWAEPRGCSRRYLKVDFADIGWSDWIISPKAYDAFYCAGSCQFPMNKALKPSNHATIQSIVRAVGVVPGVPEPCCVPEKMSSLSILFFDEQANVVLKVYPNMSVESCACR